MGHWVSLGEKSLNGYERNTLFRNLGQDGSLPRFSEVGFLTGADRIEDGRGAVAADFDRDGDLDVVVQSFSQPLVFLNNEHPSRGHWLQVALRGSVSNRDAIGARLIAEFGNGQRQLRELGTTSGYLAGQSLVASFGLGEVDRVDRLTIRWPSGEVQVLENVPVDQRLTLREEVEAR